MSLVCPFNQRLFFSALRCLQKTLPRKQISDFANNLTTAKINFNNTFQTSIISCTAIMIFLKYSFIISACANKVCLDCISQLYFAYKIVCWYFSKLLLKLLVN